MEELIEIVVRVKPIVPGGIRRRAGFAFSLDPVKVKVTKDQLKLIKEDTYLLIVERGNSLIEAKPYIAPELIVKEDKEMTKKDIIQKLLDLGLQEGLDFNEKANKTVLLDILNDTTK